MRIAHLISSSGIYGAERIVLSLSQSLNGTNDQCFVGAIRDTRFPRLPLIERAEAIGLPTFVVESDGRFDRRTIAQLNRFLVQHRIDILHTHNYKSDLIGLISGRATRTPVVATAHGYTHTHWSVALYERLDRWVLRWGFGRVVVVTDTALSRLPETKRRVIHNGLQVDCFHRNQEQRDRMREQFGIKDHETLIATVGRLSKEKNQEMLLRAAACLCHEHPNLKFLLVGGGPEDQHLRLLADALNLGPKVVFTGVIEEMVPVYQAMDVFVLSSVTEGMPLTILEAMAAGVPVVATHVGGVPELIRDHQTGLLVASKDVSGLTESLKRLIASRVLRRQLAEDAFAFVSTHFSQQEMVERYVCVYEEVLAKARSGQSQEPAAEGLDRHSRAGGNPVGTYTRLDAHPRGNNG